MSLVPFILIATSVASALLVWMFGVRWAIGLLVGVLVLVGVVAVVWSKEVRDVFLLAGAFALPFVVAGGALGVASGALLQRRRFLPGLLFLAPPVLVLINMHSSQQKEDEIQRRGMEFITTEKHILKLLGQPIQASLVTWTKDRHGSIRRLEYSFTGHPSIYALVDVTRDKSSLSFHLACVTSLYMGQREVGKDD
jgi:hypothetical protein